MSAVVRSSRMRRGWLPAAVLILLAITLLFVWRSLPPPSVELDVVNLGDETVELQLYGGGLRQPVASGLLAPRQRLSLTLLLNDDGELRLRAVSSRAAVDAVLLPQATELRERELLLEVRDGRHFLLVPAH